MDVPGIGGSEVVIQADVAEYVMLRMYLRLLILITELLIVLDTSSMVPLVSPLEPLRIIESLSPLVTKIGIARYVAIY
jgi:hypothetical protein